jgi:hypothetical protein
MMKFLKVKRYYKLMVCGGLLSLSLLLTHCSPVELPPDVAGEPVFEIAMSEEGGQTFSFAGGVDGYRMFTSFEQGADGVYTYIGELKKEDVNLDTFPSLRFEFRDDQVNPQNIDIDEALQAIGGFYDQTLTGSIDTTYLATFSASTGQSCPNLPASAFSWDFDDGTFGEGYAVQHAYSTNEERIVNLEINGPDGEYVSVSRKLSFEANALPCGLDVSDFSQGNIVNLTVFPINAIQPYSYSWSNGSTAQTVSVVLDSSLYAQPFCVTLTDAIGCQSSWCGGFFGNYQICSAQFSYASSIVIDSTQTPTQLSTVTIIYNDGQGGAYRSDRQIQSNSAYFYINSTEEFQENAFGYPTKKFNIDFNCDLISATGALIRINSGQGTIGVAYPED